MRARYVAPSAAIAMLVLSGCQTSADEGPQPAPPLSGHDLDGEAHDIAELDSDVVVVNAWASWCGPCREEMPVLEEAHRTLSEDGLHVVGINVRDRPESAQRLVEETGVTFSSLVDAEGTLAVEWGVVGMPQTFVVNAEGLIVDRRFGAVDQEWVDATVAPLVTGETAQDTTPGQGSGPDEDAGPGEAAQ